MSNCTCNSLNNPNTVTVLVTLLSIDADTPPWGDGNADFLAPLVQLEILDLARTYIGSTHMEVLGKLTNLRQLDLSHTSMEGPTLRAVGSALTGLERLDVSYTHVVGFMLPPVAWCSMLNAQCSVVGAQCSMPNASASVHHTPFGSRWCSWVSRIGTSNISVQLSTSES